MRYLPPSVGPALWGALIGVLLAGCPSDESSQDGDVGDTAGADTAGADAAAEDTEPAADAAPPEDTNSPEDTAPPRDSATSVDTAPPEDTATALADLGQGCEADADCASGECFGNEEAKLCVARCQSGAECPKGWYCDEVGPQRIGLCVHPDQIAGLPCQDDGGCLGGYQCLPRQDGTTRCAFPCVRGACAGGLVCDALACVPIGGEPCTDFHVAVRAQGRCATQSIYGRCDGALTCVRPEAQPACDAPLAQAEVCDGMDNDCDAEIDEALCDDGNPCTDDACDAVLAGGCRFTPTPGLPCDDGNACTEGERCSSEASCVGRDVCACETADDCLVGSGQDPSCVDVTCQANQCVIAPRAAGATCSTHLTCLGEGICDGAGGCIAQPDLCEDDNPCTDDTCTRQGCVFLPGTPGRACDDGDTCTEGDLCVAGGICLSGAPVRCDDDNACTTDRCDSQDGCVNDFNSAPCDDGEDCTQDDRCRAGQCLGLFVDCGSLDTACTEGRCSPDGCVAVPVARACDDDDPCTVDDQCRDGACGGGPLDCTELDTPCGDAACAAGVCIAPNVACSYVMTVHEPMASVDQPAPLAGPDGHGFVGSVGHGTPVGPAKGTAGQQHGIQWGFHRVRLK